MSTVKSNFTTGLGGATLRPRVMKWNFLWLLWLPVLLGGCVVTSSSITNLTPSQLVRSNAGFYPVEIVWETNQRAVVEESIQPVVQVGTNNFVMQRTKMTKNRWEVLLPLETGASNVLYRVRVDYQFYDVPVRRSNSQMSPMYELRVVEPVNAPAP